jgi:vacuolar-type H+-ATPase subunit I/STV1
MSVNPNAVGGVNATNIQSLDLETALMMVQSQRATMLEDQLKEQISAVQAKNTQIAKLNTLMSAVNSMIESIGSSASATATVGGRDCSAINTAANDAGIPEQVIVNSGTTKGDLSALVQNLKGQVDNLSNTQQMDMLRLQSLSNKRNEAFDTMTNFIKKMQDNRSSIISNMR